MERLTNKRVNMLNEASAMFKASVDLLTNNQFAPMPPIEVIPDMHDPELWRKHFSNVCKACLNQLEPDRN